MEAVLSPQGTAEKPNPGLLTTKEPHRCCQLPLCHEPERLICLMPFSKSSVQWYGSPLFSGVESFQNHRRLWGFWKVKYPDSATALPCNSLAGRLYNFPTTNRPRPRNIFHLNSFLSSACKIILSTDNGMSRARMISVIQ